MEATTAWLGAGSNLGDRIQHLKEAVTLLNSRGIHVVRTASVYETEPVGFKSDSSFLNTVFEVTFAGTALEMLQHISEVENICGRVREPADRYVSRTLDLDILLFGSEVINTRELIIPHPRMHERNFVLVPLCEIAGRLCHPVFNRTIYDLKKVCVDQNAALIHDNALSVNR